MLVAFVEQCVFCRENEHEDKMLKQCNSMYYDQEVRCRCLNDPFHMSN